MLQRDFGSTGLRVSALGFGAGRVGGGDITNGDAEHLLNLALDLGVSLIDTAPSYGLSEERIGRFLSHRRDEFVLATKCGYGAPGLPDWTPQCVWANVDAALRRLRTDRIDVLLFHSCPLSTLQREGLIEALERARQAGKIRVAGYSGENEPLEFAAASGRFGALETSLSLFDQRSLERVVPVAAEKGVGIVAKRPLGNAPWRSASLPDVPDDAARAYWERARELAFNPRGLDWSEFALRFAAFQPGVASAIAGTASPARLKENAAAIAKGPLDPDWVRDIRERWGRVGSDWPGMI